MNSLEARPNQFSANVCKLHDPGASGEHLALVLQPAQMSLRDLKVVFVEGGFGESFGKGAIIELLKAVDFLHSQCVMVHTDIHPGNMLLGYYDEDSNTHLQNLENGEVRNPVPRKLVSPGRTISLSRIPKPAMRPMQLTDFGEARIGGGPHLGDIMPLEYRAPEVLAQIPWSYPVDVWSVALRAWDMLVGEQRLFTAWDADGDMYDAAHLAQLIAALGDAPECFKTRNQKYTIEYWDEEGKWTGMAPILKERTLEAMIGENAQRLEDPSVFLSFLRTALKWVPEERPTAKALLEHPWLG